MEPSAQHQEHSPQDESYSERFADHMAKHSPEITLSPSAISLIGSNLDFIRDIYSNPELPTHLQYHNDTHSFGVTTRTIWQLATLHKGLRLPLTDHDYELAALAASSHDIVKSSIRTGDQIIIPVCGQFVTLENDSTKSDERLSAEFATQAMTLLGDYSAEDKNRVAAAILATEVTFEGIKVSLKHVKTIKDPIAVSLMIADTNDIFARSRDVAHAIGENVTDLSLEILRSGKDVTSEALTKTVAELLRYQSDFLKERRSDYAVLTARLVAIYGGSDQLDGLRKRFQTVTSSAVTYAERLEANTDKVVADFSAELTKLKETSLKEKAKIRSALLRAIGNLPPSK